MSKMDYNAQWTDSKATVHFWGISSVGRTSALQAGGQRSESAILHNSTLSVRTPCRCAHDARPCGVLFVFESEIIKYLNYEN